MNHITVFFPYPLTLFDLIINKSVLALGRELVNKLGTVKKFVSLKAYAVPSSSMCVFFAMMMSLSIFQCLFCIVLIQSWFSIWLLILSKITKIKDNAFLFCLVRKPQSLNSQSMWIWHLRSRIMKEMLNYASCHDRDLMGKIILHNYIR